MQDSTTLARPYAKAAFEYASAHAQLAAWSDLLQQAEMIMADNNAAKLLADPSVTREQAYQLFADLCKEQLNPARDNFLRLLADNQRLTVLPEIAAIFDKLRAEHEQILQAEVTTVVELTKPQQDKLLQALKRRLNKNIILSFSQDTHLLGGLLIRAGDKVIDLSLRGQLQQLNNQLRIA